VANPELVALRQEISVIKQLLTERLEILDDMLEEFVPETDDLSTFDTPDFLN
jgi:hypothetical protein